MNNVADIDVFELAHAKGHAAGTVAVRALLRIAPLLASTGGDLTWRIDGMQDEQARPAALLTVSGSVALTCDKCGLRVDLPIEIAARFWFVHDEDELNALPIKDEDADPLIGSRHFRLLELIEDEVILALPISARHAQCRPPQVESDETRSRSHRPFSPLAALKPRH